MEQGKAELKSNVIAAANKAVNAPSTGGEVEDKTLNEEYIDRRSVTVALVNTSSLYRKVNSKTLPKRQCSIGSSVNSSRILSSNKEEIETYFPHILGIASNNPEFITRVKLYLANIQIYVDELGVTFDTSFRYRRKADYFAVKAEEEAIEDKYSKVNRQDSKALKEAMKIRIDELNALESRKHKYGSPLNFSDYIAYRHCLLYPDVAKDLAFINSDPNIRFYIKDDNKEKEAINKLRNAVVKAKKNYVELLGDDNKFEAVYVQYCVQNKLPIFDGLSKDITERQIELDTFSTQEPVLFNKLCEDKDIAIKGLIEKLVSTGELYRISNTQNITTAAGDFIGANMKEAITWFKNPNNVAAVEGYKNKLKFKF